jgi:glutamyl-Q tRNA(Asp) synthetase
VSVNTATETTDTAERPGYVGRFAPSPTGDLHLGSLLAAVGSYLDARAHDGCWFVRMEDLDTPRVVPGSAANILCTLERFGLEWDGDVVYQSERVPLYRDALHKLKLKECIFECSCSRRELGGAEDTVYPGTCRAGPTQRNVPTATRFHIPDAFVVFFDDRIQGHCSFAQRDLGDFVIRRKDGIIAYQLAVVVDDCAQHISHVVRGADLLPSTGWQIALQRALDLATPSYAHLPLVVEKNAEKLGKSKRSVAVEARFASAYLTTVLRMLNHAPPPELESAPPRELLEWAVSNWRIELLEKLQSVTPRDTVHAK